MSYDEESMFGKTDTHGVYWKQERQRRTARNLTNEHLWMDLVPGYDLIAKRPLKNYKRSETENDLPRVGGEEKKIVSKHHYMPRGKERTLSTTQTTYNNWRKNSNKTYESIIKREYNFKKSEYPLPVKNNNR